MRSNNYFIKEFICIILLVITQLSSIAQTGLSENDFNPDLSDEEILRRLQLIVERLMDNSNHRPTYDFTTSPSPYLHHSGGNSSSFINHYTGTMTRNIEIFPGIDLSYRASGILVDEIASWVGLGWQLHTGGVITRSVRGFPDEIIYLHYDENCQCNHYYDGWISPSGSSSQKVLSFDPDAGIEARSERIEEILGINVGLNEEYNKFDSEPDLFSFQFGNFSGSFVFDHAVNEGTHEARLNPDQNLKVSYTIIQDKGSHQYNYISSFTIIDPSGTKYIFDQIETVYSTSQINDVTNGNREPYTGDPPSGGFVNMIAYSGEFVQSWFLSQIILPDNSEIDFTYTDEKYHQDPLVVKAFRSYEDVYDEEQLYEITINGEIEGNDGPFVDSKRLIEIESDQTRIEFIADHIREDINIDGVSNETLFPRALTKINVYSKYKGQEDLVSQTEYSYSYYLSETDNRGFPCPYSYQESPHLYKRLRLEAIQTYNKDEVLPPYTFEYEGDWLPARYSYAKDFWGYFNDNNEAASLIPEVYLYSSLEGYRRFSIFNFNSTTDILPGEDREADNSYSQTGILTGIINPQGGEESYTYELNSFVVQDNNGNDFEAVGGGLRISSISVDPNQQGLSPITTNYNYTSDGTNSSGKLITMPIFGYFDPTNTDCNTFYFDEYPNWDADDYNYYYVRTGYNMAESAGVIVGYDKVTEQPGDGSIGYTEYFFKNQAHCDDYQQVDYPWFSTSESQITPTNSDYQYFSIQPDTNIPYSITGLNFGVSSYPYAPNIDISWYRGSMSEKILKNSSHQMVSKETFEYGFFGKNIEGSQTVPYVTYGLKTGFLDNNTLPEGCTISDDYLRSDAYITSKYPIHTEIKPVLESLESITYNSAGESLSQIGSNEYNIIGQLKSHSDQIADEGEIKTIYTYPIDFWNPKAPPTTDISSITDPHTLAIIHMSLNNYLDYPVETLVLRKDDPQSDFKVISAGLVLYDLYTINGVSVPKPEEILQLQVDNPLTYNTSEFIDGFLNENDNYSFSWDSRYYEQKIVYEDYNSKGNLLQARNFNNAGASCTIYDDTGERPIASTQNASLEEISHTGFEYNDDQGWILSGQGVQAIETTDALSGSYCLTIPSLDGRIEKTFTINYGQNDFNGYQFSTWKKGSATYNVKAYINGAQVYSSTNGTGSDWEKHLIEIDQSDLETYQGQQVSIKVEVRNISSATLYLDDVRFCPSDASMTTFCYNQIGQVTSISDPNQQYQFYEYDDLGRVYVVRDHDGNILQMNDFHSGSAALFYCTNQSFPGQSLDVNSLVKVIPDYKMASSYEVDFDDGTALNTTNWNLLTHQYQTDGIYTVSMTITLDGQPYTYSKEVVILPN